MKIAFYTLGCKVNQYETDIMENKFKNKGYEIVDFDDKADIYVVNSCSVTNLSTRKSRMFLSKAKRKNKEAVVVLAGCYSQELADNKDEIEKLDNVDIIIGNEDKNNIVDFIEDNLKSKKIKFSISDISKVKEYRLNNEYIEASEVRESVKIEDGCNNFCSYCIIPYLRGRVRSRKLDDIINEVNVLISKGVKEIVLVGIEIASYGLDFNQEKSISLIDVIEAVSNIDKNIRIRLGSIEPRWLTDLVIDRLVKIENLCNHFHISVQSLDDEVLKNMNRKYTSNFVEDVIRKIRQSYSEKAKRVSFTCDVIVGFPGETNEQFENTYMTLKKLEFMQIHAFKYSKRKFTKAQDMTNQVDGNAKKIRSERLIELSDLLFNEYVKTLKSSKVSVLFESYEDNKLYGYTTDYVKVVARGDESLCRTIQEVELVGQEQSLLVGEIVNVKN